MIHNVLNAECARIHKSQDIDQTSWKGTQPGNMTGVAIAQYTTKIMLIVSYDHT